MLSDMAWFWMFLDPFSYYCWEVMREDIVAVYNVFTVVILRGSIVCIDLISKMKVKSQDNSGIFAW